MSDETPEAKAIIGIVDGRIGVNAEIETPIRVETPNQPPLSELETHATLYLAADDARVAVDLDAEGLDALVDDLYHAQERAGGAANE